MNWRITRWRALPMWAMYTYINWYTNHELAYYPVACVTNVAR